MPLHCWKYKLAQPSQKNSTMEVPQKKKKKKGKKRKEG